MVSLYMNNFRGFQDTVFEIHNVNFFVGENSTGKSSLLYLIELFSNPGFWFSLDFNMGNFEFGGYKDIISAISTDKSEFQIGLYKPKKENKRPRTAYMLHFKEGENGLPKLFRFSLLTSKHLATLNISEKRSSAYLSTNLPQNLNLDFPKESFDYIRKATKEIKKGFKILSDHQARLIRKYPIGRFPQIIDELFGKNFSNVELGPFEFPVLNMSFEGMAPIRTKPLRTYDGYTKRFSPEGDHTPYIIRKNLSQDNSDNTAFKKAIESFGKESGLFKKVSIAEFGKDNAAPFEVKITLNKVPLRINSVGYGVSQSLPIIVELLTHGKRSWLAIQQPEVHLHPKAQAALGDVLFQVSTKEKQTLFIETHSDYLLDRFRINLRDNIPDDFSAQVLYFERSEGVNKIYPMIIDNNGEYPEDQPPGFRDFFLQEQRRILGV